MTPIYTFWGTIGKSQKKWTDFLRGHLSSRGIQLLSSFVGGNIAKQNTNKRFQGGFIIVYENTLQALSPKKQKTCTLYNNLKYEPHSILRRTLNKKKKWHQLKNHQLLRTVAYSLFHTHATESICKIQTLLGCDFQQRRSKLTRIYLRDSQKDGFTCREWQYCS